MGVGACICGFFFPRITAGKWKLFSIGFVLILDALGLAVIPIVKEMWLLGTIFLVTAACSGGWLTAGVNSIILNTWGSSKSRPYIASTQFAFSVGSILAPFLVGLYMDDDIEKSCDNRDDLYYKKTILYSHHETRSLNSVGIVTGNTTEPEE